MKLIIVPLAFLIAFASLSQMGLGQLSTTATGNINTGNVAGYGSSNAVNGYYDSDAHFVMYANGTPAGEPGKLSVLTDVAGNIRIWHNGSNINGYPLQNSQGIADFSQLDVDTGYALGGSWGLIAVVIAVMVLATVAGLHFLSSGESEFSVSTIVKGSAFLTLWGIFSALSVSLIDDVPYFGWTFYFILTALYTFGMINSFGSSGSDL